MGPAGSRQRSPFNIPGTNKPRPEHHRPPAPMPQYPAGRDGAHPIDSFHPVNPSAFGNYRSPPVPVRDNDASVVEIVRPSNENRTTKPSSSPLYSSFRPTKPAVPALGKSSSNIQNFVDLTTNHVGAATNGTNYHEDFGAMDAYNYVDSTKANENIKELLEGAMEDEDDKPRTRSRKKKVEKQVADLSDKLKGASVGDEKKEQTPGDGQDGEVEEGDEEEDDGTREGLKVKLLPHQIEGVDWMKDKETGLKKTRGVLPKGGILADDMGLGKTIQAIALFLRNPRFSGRDVDDKKDKGKSQIPTEVGRGTLVVAPVALMKQWESEIESKVESSHRMQVCIYHGQGRTKYAKELGDYDVVITTYGTLSSEYAQLAKSTTSKPGCFGVHWFRIVLDEAHTIKNRNAKATQAAYALKSHYRWCLTGTPMQNNLDELQSLIRFLQIKPYDELAAWKDQITRPLNNGRGGLAIRRLRVYLKAFMKRRTKDVLTLDGGLGSKDKSEETGSKVSNGFQITKRDVFNIEADFTAEEREFYSRLEERADKSLENMMGSNNLSYASALVLLLRLRQACNHPDLVKGDLAQEKEALANSDPSKTSKNGDDIDNVADMLGGLSVVSRRCDVCQSEIPRQEAKSGATRCAECDGNLQAAVPNPSTRKQKNKKKKKTKKMKKDKKSSENRPNDALKSSRIQRNRPIVIDSDDEDDVEGIVPEDQRCAEKLGTAGGADDENAEGGGEWLDSDGSETAGESGDEDEDGEESTDDDLGVEDGSIQVVASTKVREVMKILKHEADDYKFIVFSVFTTMLDKIEPFLKRANIGYARYDGKMRNDQREASLHKLRNSKNTRLLLCSLRAGSLGLNLTAANRVIILEPFWNPVSAIIYYFTPPF